MPLWPVKVKMTSELIWVDSTHFFPYNLHIISKFLYYTLEMHIIVSTRMPALKLLLKHPNLNQCNQCGDE